MQRSLTVRVEGLPDEYGVRTPIIYPHEIPHPDSEGVIHTGDGVWVRLAKGRTKEESRLDEIVLQLYEDVWKARMDEARACNQSSIDIELFDRGSPDKISFYDACIRFAKRRGLRFMTAKIPCAPDVPSQHVLTILV